MPEIQIRPAVPADIPLLVALDHDFTSEYVWQMDFEQDERQIGVSFRQIKLPRSVRVEYPRSARSLMEDWSQRAGLLVGLIDDERVGYVSLALEMAPKTAWITDLAVARRLRRKGIGSTLVMAAQEWAGQRRSTRVLMEMQPKNYPAIRLAQKLGFDFCGYQDQYYANRDIALFFGKSA